MTDPKAAWFPKAAWPPTVAALNIFVIELNALCEKHGVRMQSDSEHHGMELEKGNPIIYELSNIGSYYTLQEKSQERQ